jgi:hypothetical protein
MDDGIRAATRALVNRGIDRYDAGEYVEARRALLEAYQVVKVPTIALWAARASERLGNLVAAAELYREALVMQPTELWVGDTQQRAQQEASAALSLVTARIASLKIVLDDTIPSSAEVTLDGTSVPWNALGVSRPVDPGDHIVELKLGRDRVTERVTLDEAEEKTLSLRPPGNSGANVASASSPTIGAPATPSNLAAATTANITLKQNQVATAPQASPLRTIGWLGVAVGAVGLAWGGAAGAVVAYKHQQLMDDGCTSRQCFGSRFEDRVQSYRTWQLLSTAGFIAGGLGGAAGVTLLLTSPKATARPSAALLIAPNALRVVGGF